VRIGVCAIMGYADAGMGHRRVCLQLVQGLLALDQPIEVVIWCSRRSDVTDCLREWLGDGCT